MEEEGEIEPEVEVEVEIASEDNDSTDMKRIAKKFSDDIITNEIVVKELDLHLLSLLEQTSPGTPFSQDLLQQLIGFILSREFFFTHTENLQQRMGMTPQVGTKLKESLFPFHDKDIRVSKDSLVQAVSELLYRELVFTKLARGQDKKKVTEFTNLADIHENSHSEKEQMVSVRRPSHNYLRHLPS